jgi:hypothetical protein
MFSVILNKIHIILAVWFDVFQMYCVPVYLLCWMYICFVQTAIMVPKVNGNGMYKYVLFRVDSH